METKVTEDWLVEIITDNSKFSYLFPKKEMVITLLNQKDKPKVGSLMRIGLDFKFNRVGNREYLLPVVKDMMDWGFWPSEKNIIGTGKVSKVIENDDGTYKVVLRWNGDK